MKQAVLEIQVKGKVEEWLLMPLQDARACRGKGAIQWPLTQLAVKGVAWGYPVPD